VVEPVETWWSSLSRPYPQVRVIAVDNVTFVNDPATMNAYCYILECRDGSYYVGSTIDLPRRIAEHQTGHGAAYTRRRLPVRLVWCEEFHRIDDAFAREKQIQNWGRAKRQALIDGRLGDLPRLARSYADRGKE